MAEHTQPHPSQRRYPAELKERAVRLVFETAAEQGERHGAVTKVARQLGIGPESLRHWVHQAEVDGGARAGLTTEERGRMKELERENRELRRANEILKSAAAFLRGGARPPLPAMTSYIDEHRRSFGVEPICRTLAIAPSSYYAARRRPPSARSVRTTPTLADVIRRIHRANFGVYGSASCGRPCGREGVDAGRDQVARIMRAVGLQGVDPHEDGPDDDSRRSSAQRPADLVERVFAAPAPNRLWVADLERHEALSTVR